MDEKICKEDIRNALRREMGLSEAEATKALDCFFKLIVKALEEERYVKVKGLGIFKLIDVESRRIVDVNTGEHVEVPEHKRVSFSVDPNLKKLINKPFEHFDTVELNENVSLENVTDRGEMNPETTDKSPAEALETVVTDEGQHEADGSLKKEDMDEGEMTPDESGHRVSRMMKREELQRMEKLIEKEERKNRLALLFVALLMLLVVIAGLVFMLAPEWVQECLYGY